MQKLNRTLLTFYILVTSASQLLIKVFDILIEAWEKVHRLRPDTKLFMLGGGNAEEWTALSNSLECNDSIEFLGYWEKLTPFFLQTCCLLLPSRKEGISNALLEAQSFGLPAIVSDILGNREIILHEINGRLLKFFPLMKENLSRFYVLCAYHPSLSAEYRTGQC